MTRQATRDIDEVWGRIEAHAGETFRQIRGGEFTYTATSSYISPDRTSQHIPKAHFERALAMVQLTDTVPLQDLRGPSYIYAVLIAASGGATGEPGY